METNGEREGGAGVKGGGIVEVEEFDAFWRRFCKGLVMVRFEGVKLRPLLGEGTNVECFSR